MDTGLVWEDTEILRLLRSGLQAQFYAEASPERTKASIEQQTDSWLDAVSIQEARRILAAKVKYPQLRLTTLIDESIALMEAESEEKGSD